MQSRNITTDFLVPSIYQAVEYIKSSGRCAINTGYSPTGSYLRIELKFKYNGISSELGDTPFVYGYTQSNFCFLTRNSGTNKFEIGNGGTAYISSKVVSAGTDYETIITADNGTQTLNINGDSFSSNCGTSLNTGVLPIFCRYGDNRYEYFATNMTLYYFRIYSAQNTIEREFVPCYRKSDSVIGLRDRIGKQFYTNQGTGSFTKGPDVQQ